MIVACIQHHPGVSELARRDITVTVLRQMVDMLGKDHQEAEEGLWRHDSRNA